MSDCLRKWSIMFLVPFLWRNIAMKRIRGYMFNFGNLLRREGIPKRVFKFHKFYKDYLLNLPHLILEFVTCHTWVNGLYIDLVGIRDKLYG